MNRSNFQNILSIPHIINVIYACENNGNISEIRKKLKLSSNALIYPALNYLTESNILIEDFKRKGGIQRKFHLTEKGLNILNILKKIELFFA